MYDRLYILFLYYFNVERDYFECHEVLEELWLEEGRSALYQGLLQVAVGLYHFRNGNVNGAIKLLSQAVQKLERYPAQSLGIRLHQILEDSRQYLARLRLFAAKPFEFYDLNIIVIDPLLRDALEKVKANPPRTDGADQ
jgi:predicted metal-dependent hydrolase